MTTRTLSVVAIAGVMATVVGLVVPKGQGSEPGGLWAAVTVAGVEAEYYDSMADMARAADAVIVGRIISVSEGRVFGTPDRTLKHPERAQTFMANLTIEVDEVIRGSLKPGWKLEVMAPGRDRIDELGVYAKAEERSIFFLRDEEAWTRRLGWSDEYVKSAAGIYRLVRQGAVIVDHHSEALLPVPDEEALAGIDGRRFIDVLAELREL